MDESRKKFEEWIEAERPMLFLVLRNKDPDVYLDFSTENLWQSWKASRESLRKEMEVD